VAGLKEHTHCLSRASPAPTDQHDLPIARQFVLASSELTEWDVTGAVCVAGSPLVRFAHVDEQGTRGLATERFVYVDLQRLLDGAGCLAEQEHSAGLLMLL
jgi:hypothetical protein